MAAPSADASSPGELETLGAHLLVADHEAVGVFVSDGATPTVIAVD